MSRPSNLIYGASDQPPAVVCLLAAAQLLTVVAPIMIYPILVMRETGATDQAIAEMISLSFLALGVATPLQALTQRWIGSGYLISVAPAAPYVPVARAYFPAEVSGLCILLIGVIIGVLGLARRAAARRLPDPAQRGSLARRAESGSRRARIPFPALKQQ